MSERDSIVELSEKRTFPLFEKSTKMLEAGQVCLDPGEECEKHTTGHYEEMLIILDGEGRILLDGKELCVKGNSVVYIPPYTFHSLVAGDRNLRYIYMATPTYFDPEHIDWIEVWNSLREKSVWTKYSGEVSDPWEGIADHYDEWSTSINYPGKLLDKVFRFLKNDSKVLEIGPGTGAFTLPIAKWVEEVVALEPSAAMRKILEKKAEFNNISILPQRFEDVEDIGKFDVVLAAYSLGVKDLKSTIEKMANLCKGYCIIIDGDRATNDGIRVADTILKKKLEVEEVPWCSYLSKINALHQMGIFANVEIENERGDVLWRIYLKQRKNMYERLGIWKEGVEIEVMVDLKNKDLLVDRNGELYLLSNGVHALIWWANR